MQTPDQPRSIAQAGECRTHRAPAHGLRAILFDFGGTLDGPGLTWGERFAAAYAEIGIAIPGDRLRDATGYATRRAFQTREVAELDLRETVAFHVRSQFERLGIDDPVAAEAIVTRFVWRSSAALAESRGVLGRLGRRFELGIASNFYGNLHRVLAEAGIAPLLSAIVDSTVVGVSKPDPRLFSLAVEQMAVRPTEALLVGDSLAQDIRPAQAAGLRTAWLVGERAERDSPSADFHLRRLGDLEDLLAG